MTENQWKAKLVRALRASGAAVLSAHGHAMQEPGWPDIFVAGFMFHGWVELKMERGELTTAQRIIGRKLQTYSTFFVLRLMDRGTIRVEDADGKILDSVMESEIWTCLRMLSS